jgi:hypothetical protein
VHYDFTHQGDMGPHQAGVGDHMPELLARLAAYPVAGCFEDVHWAADHVGWQQLRAKVSKPLVMHGGVLGPPFREVLERPADAYMLGRATPPPPPSRPEGEGRRSPCLGPRELFLGP